MPKADRHCTHTHSFGPHTNMTTTKTSPSSATMTPPLSAPPPWQAVATLVAITAVFVHCFPTLEEIDRYATMDTFTNRVFPQYLSLQGLAIVRTLFALLVFGHSFHSVFLFSG